MKAKCATNEEIETQILQYLKTHEFFWIEDLKNHLSIGPEPKVGQINGSSYKFFYYNLDKLRKNQQIICTEKKGMARQYFSKLFA